MDPLGRCEPSASRSAGLDHGADLDGASSATSQSHGNSSRCSSRVTTDDSSFRPAATPFTWNPCGCRPSKCGVPLGHDGVMTVVGGVLVAKVPLASAGGGVLGDGFVWCGGDDERGFDPVTDVAFGDVGPLAAAWIDAMVEHCAQGLSMLEAVDVRRGHDDGVGHRLRTTPPSGCCCRHCGCGSSRYGATVRRSRVLHRQELDETPFASVGCRSPRLGPRSETASCGAGVGQRVGWRPGRCCSDPVDGAYRREPSHRARGADCRGVEPDGRRDGRVVCRVRTPSTDVGGVGRSDRRRRTNRTQPSTPSRGDAPGHRRRLGAAREFRRGRRAGVLGDLLLVRRPRIRQPLRCCHPRARQRQCRCHRTVPNRNRTPRGCHLGNGTRSCSVPTRPRSSGCHCGR